jgi:hypothetical protein
MSHPKKRHWRAEVEWEDSTILHEGWQEIAAVLKRRHAVRCLSVGIVIADDERGIALAASVHGSGVAGVTMIPRRAIVKRKRLR